MIIIDQKSVIECIDHSSLNQTSVSKFWPNFVTLPTDVPVNFFYTFCPYRRSTKERGREGLSTQLVLVVTEDEEVVYHKLPGGEKKRSTVVSLSNHNFPPGLSSHRQLLHVCLWTKQNQRGFCLFSFFLNMLSPTQNLFRVVPPRLQAGNQRPGQQPYQVPCDANLCSINLCRPNQWKYMTWYTLGLLNPTWMISSCPPRHGFGWFGCSSPNLTNTTMPWAILTKND